MKQNEKYKRSEKFWKGESSRSEEEMFFQQNIIDPDSPANGVYAAFIHEARKKSDMPLEELVWDRISKRNRFRKRTLYMVSVAASFLIIISSFLFVTAKQNQKNREAEFALLEDALMHVSEGIDPKNDSQVNILYEDEMIVIVSENSN